MSTLNDDLQAAQAENSPSVAAAVEAALAKEQPAQEQAPEPEAVDEDPIVSTDIGPA